MPEQNSANSHYPEGRLCSPEGRLRSAVRLSGESLRSYSSADCKVSVVLTNLSLKSWAINVWKAAAIAGSFSSIWLNLVEDKL